LNNTPFRAGGATRRRALLFPVRNLAEIGAVLQQVEEGAATERRAAQRAAASGRARLGANFVLVQPDGQGEDRSKFEVALED